MNDHAWWGEPLEELLVRLDTSRAGLTTSEAVQRRSNTTARPGRLLSTDCHVFLSQFRNPITMLLVATSVLSMILRDHTDAAMILAILLMSVLLGFWQERSANHTVAKLLELIKVRTNVLRDSSVQSISADEVVSGDVIELSAGSNVPADCRLLDARDLQLDESALTGESFPVEKRPIQVAIDNSCDLRSGAVFLGTHVVSGTGRVVVVTTGRDTEFGSISERFRQPMPETEFERGVRQFGLFLMQLTLAFVVIIFAINVYLHKPIIESFLFALALSVGMTPQLLPAIITLNLTHGAGRLAKQEVIVRKLASIENLGSIDVLCSDKTGTLTEGTVELRNTLDPQGNASRTVSRLAYLNALHETGFSNPIDDAIRANPPELISASVKLDEIPYDFIRKRLSILVRFGERNLLISKGAVSNILDVSTFMENADGERSRIEPNRSRINEQIQSLSRAGYRLLGVAYRDLDQIPEVRRDHEQEMIFVGFLVFSDPLKSDVVETIHRLQNTGVQLKIVTGDNRWVASEIGRQVGLSVEGIITGTELMEISESALIHRVSNTTVFAEIEPHQKERIVLALRKAQHVVGYLGDGINDVTALHAADIGMSVNGAVDIAKEAADIILLRKDLTVVADGIIEGRKTFTNTSKYIFMATSANFGNMFSMAGASLFLPFLPLLPHQILLENLMTDISAMTIVTDQVDDESVASPRRWNVISIRNFMLVFGLLSSVFDYLTFGFLLWLMKVDTIGFRTCWFVESVCSAVLIVLVIRTRRPVIASRPSRTLALVSLLIVGVTLLLPISPIAGFLGFAPQSHVFLLVLIAVVGAYVSACEFVKSRLLSSQQPPDVFKL